MGPFTVDADGFATVGDRGSLAGGVLTVAGRGAEVVLTGGATVLVADVELGAAPHRRRPTWSSSVCRTAGSATLVAAVVTDVAVADRGPGGGAGRTVPGRSGRGCGSTCRSSR